MSFQIPGGNQPLPKDIISLFAQLGKLDRMSYQQRDTVNEYEQARASHKDIAIEMPAGHGKTLVGGLIGEFNRLTKKWRVVYACATRQLAYQTTGLLNSYGINAVTLVGRSADFLPRDFGKYNRADAIAVTTYSHIFNFSPAFNDAHQLIFDDAHAADYSIQGFWGLTINRRKYERVFEALFETLGDSVSEHIQDKVLHGTYDPLTDSVDIIPQALWISKIDLIRTLLDSKVDGTDLYYSWSRIRTYLHACQIYITHSTITVRPVLPPNLRHGAFHVPQERIYMTATIGYGGELERMFGVQYIHRISKFETKENKVSGRRLILFPEDHFDEDIWSVLAHTIRMQPRVLCLCPSETVADSVEETMRRIVGEYSIYRAHDVEDSLDIFTSSERGILLLHGRYEGIDLKDDDCRLQLFFDLPLGVGLQDKFLQDRLNATEIFNNMLVTRVIQGLGRCTRSANDHAAVLFIGGRIGKYLFKDEFRKMLPAEIDAEMTLGFSQIDHIKDVDAWKSALYDFYGQNSNWQHADYYIRAETENKKNDRLENPTTSVFQETVSNELEYLYAIWDRQWEKAHRAADVVLSAYKDEKLNGYRAWWNYLMACIGYLQGDTEKAKDYNNRAVAASSYKLWLDKRIFDTSINEEAEYPVELQMQIHSIMTNLEIYGDRINRFDRDWQKVIEGLGQKDSTQYEVAFNDFGRFLGYHTERPQGQGVPDGIWHLANFWAVFEMKTNIEDSSGEIPLDHIRQTFFHDRFVKENRQVKEQDEVFNVLICSKTRVSGYAAHATEGIFLVEPELIIDLAASTEVVLRSTLEKMKYSTMDDTKVLLANMLIEKGLDCCGLHKTLQQKLLCDAVTTG